LAAPLGGRPQTPIEAPWAMLQLAEQQSPSRLHTSPLCTQKELASWQWPSLQSAEQHCEFVLHSLPPVLHVVLSGLHWLASQRPLQHSASAAHVPRSETQTDSAQAPAMQLSVQQSVAATHGPPAAVHWEADETQVWVVLSHTPEQQSLPPRQACPKAEQVCAPFPAPAVLECPALAELPPLALPPSAA
jgi:hypothetical protein